jgi:peptidoglycan/LPS O-acetylase OafA/YrhL
MFVLATPVVSLLAFCSWRYIEAPALALKRRVAPNERYVAGDVPQSGPDHGADQGAMQPVAVGERPSAS